MKVHSLSSIAKKEESDDKRNEYYAGGVDNRGGGSGLSVVGGDDVTNRIVQQAMNNSRSQSTPKTNDSDNTTHKITLYRNGFQVNDGEFRPADDEENKAFLEEMSQGYVPAELRPKDGKTKGVNIALEDKRGEDYVPPPAPAYVAFGGTSNSLGSSARDSNTIIDPNDFSPAPANADSSPSSTLQIKLLDGKKIRVKLNNSQTLNDLIRAIVNEGVTHRFSMSAGFPPKDINISDVNVTIEASGLRSAAVTLKNE